MLRGLQIFMRADRHTGVEQARVHDLKEAGAILDIFQKYGHNEIDSARAYGAGSSEEMLGDLEWQKRGIVMDTKYYPTAAFSDSPSSKNHKRRLLGC
jgi:aflatoxin B1 aldehyde reductase